MNILIAQFWTNNLSYSQYTKSINEKYCDEKGYGYFIESNDFKIKSELNGRSFTWYKPKFLLNVLDEKNPDYILFLDADAIVCNNNYKIEEFIDENYDIVVTRDYGPSVMNAGVILLKNTDWVRSFLQKWWDISNELNGPNGEPKGYYNNGLWHDQTCFGYLYNNEVGYKSKIKIINNKILNGNVFRDPVHNNFIFHAFSHGLLKNRTLDTAYYIIFNLQKPECNELLDIVNQYMTDKHFEHNFFNLIYSDLFKGLQNKVKKFVEIGINNGESTRLWRDYFINSEIFGLDNKIEVANDNIKNKDRISLIKFDQSNIDDLNNFVTNFEDIDVILDDGSHKMQDQQITFAKLFKILKSGGIYIIEDLHTSLEAQLPQKQWCGWGDPTKTLTLDMLKKYQFSKKIESDYLSDEEIVYLNDNIESVEIYQTRPDWSITSVIKKKIND